MRFVCQSCGHNNQDDITVTDSNLIENYKLVLCRRCESLGFEPRHVIILAASAGMNETIRNIVKKKLYIGDDILLSEIV